ncbi:hypothetical protein L210DRAFT_3608397 [Boletus edulis BED1]|uniref:DUF1688-domain-containing protein n=1 Tax=Boletus edulis BED1 TaxID=1328754 RepID=A0AAD4C8R0_BOLED|nr:hypothetical protein L210DRAFT_3608397 [Boletus edulis BED1]
MFLRTLPAIRTRCAQVHHLAEKGALQYFDYNPACLDDVIEFCASIIERDFATAFDTIPPHGRWRHLDAGHPRIALLLRTWSAAGVSTTEQCKRLLDLFLVSVLLDAGAGNVWTYTEPGTGRTFSRSEGLGVASLHMFRAGVFSGCEDQPCRVDAQGLAGITTDKVAEAMQVNAANPMVGLDGRVALLVRLGGALASNPQFFGEDARPGNMLDFLETQSKLKGATRHIHIATLWTVLIDGLSAIWPSRHTLDGVPLGDVWPCPALALAQPGRPESEALVPFHKLTGWTAYSLIEPIQTLLGWKFEGVEDMTGLPEYRNGGLLIDFGVLTLRPGTLSPEYYPEETSTGIPRLPPSHPAIVEWRAMTVIELDRIADGLRRKFNLAPEQLTLAQVLESATWKGGREIAKKLRPETGGPPIDIVSDGTVF